VEPGFPKILVTPEAVRNERTASRTVPVTRLTLMTGGRRLIYQPSAPRNGDPVLNDREWLHPLHLASLGM
jgi:hypothetical protein